METTHFGYQTVDATEKSQRVRHVFDSVAHRYDIMNDIMSFGVHRLWKRFAVQLTGARRGERVLDLAGGTGDLTALLARQVGKTGEVILSDINASMVNNGRQRLVDQGLIGNIHYVLADAESLPFPDGSFSVLTMAFGLRNVTRKERALAEMYRVLKPGGRVVILEFSHPVMPGLQPVYDLYSFNILPLMGRLMVNDADSYRYLAESIRMHPDQETLLTMLNQAGLERCEYFNLSGGIVAAHRGYRL